MYTITETCRGVSHVQMFSIQANTLPGLKFRSCKLQNNMDKDKPGITYTS